MISLWTAQVFPPLHFDAASMRVYPDREGDRRANARFEIQSAALSAIEEDVNRFYETSNISDADASVYVSFEEAPLPWFATKTRADGWISAATIAVPPRAIEIEEDEQVGAMLRRFVKVALTDMHKVDLTALPLDHQTRVPLSTIRAIPGCGPKRGRWSADRDVDAFAKAALVVADLAGDALAEMHLTAWWPMLDLLPVVKRQFGSPYLSDDGRLYSVPVQPGFHRLDPVPRGEFVLGAFGAGLEALGSALGEDWGWVRSRLADAVREAGFVCSALSEPLPLSDGARRCYVEYRADPDGPAVRLHVRAEDLDRSSEWHPVGCGIGPFHLVTPLQDIQGNETEARWRIPGWTKWISANLS